MVFMNKTVLSIFAGAFLCALPLRADDVFDRFVRKVTSSDVRICYVLSVRGGGTDAGVAELCGNSYRLEGEGFDIRCDGKTVWTVDSSAKEVVVEDAASGGASLSNPASLLADMKSSFRLVNSGEAVYKGRKYHGVRLVPVGKSELSSVELFFDKENLTASTFTLSDGSIVDFEFPEVSFLEKKVTFSFDTSSLDSSWVVSDMRGF